ncbi:hypothetical protein [Sorangium sp. So ce1078]|uniref:hypothetical protein n=1 Tax=Sorangium sp. So ce1078 TaxID=3133329 RepID=UPI003F61882A
MPLNRDDPATREMIARHERTVHDDASWCPSNLEFIRRVGGTLTANIARPRPDGRAGAAPACP